LPETYNLYCDESCHLEKDGQLVMVLGAVWCPIEKKSEITKRLREIKADHGLPSHFETKWSKVSPAKTSFYLDTIDYFFDDDDLHFRALVVPDKSKLDHKAFNQKHDDFYYKIYFDMLKTILLPSARYRIYIDVKDTRGATKIKKLHEVLCNNIYDFSAEIIERVQLVRSNEMELLQLTDLLIGAISYANRRLSKSRAKMTLVDRMRERSGYTLMKTTLYRENKVNILCWQARELSD